jgi:hypothetical protein
MMLASRLCLPAELSQFEDVPLGDSALFLTFPFTQFAGIQESGSQVHDNTSCNSLLVSIDWRFTDLSEDRQICRINQTIAV